MLAPKKVKHRKHHRGRMRGLAKGGTRVAFGDYGLQAVEPSWVTARQIEAARARPCVSDQQAHGSHHHLC